MRALGCFHLSACQYCICHKWKVPLTSLLHAEPVLVILVELLVLLEAVRVLTNECSLAEQLVLSLKAMLATELVYIGEQNVLGDTKEGVLNPLNVSLCFLTLLPRDLTHLAEVFMLIASTPREWRRSMFPVSYFSGGVFCPSL